MAMPEAKKTRFITILKKNMQIKLPKLPIHLRSKHEDKIPILEDTEDTFPKFLLRNYKIWGDKIAMRKKEFGIWREYTWKDYYENVKYLSLGLISLGFKRGEKISILGDNAPQWFWAECAAQAAGGSAAGIFSDSFPPEVKYIVQHSDSVFVVVQDQEQVDKLLVIKDELPLVRKVIYWDKMGLRHYDDPILMDFEEVQKLGQEYEKSHPGAFEENVAQGKRDDLAMVLYTSGTTGLPKGAMLTNWDILRLHVPELTTINPVYAGDEQVSFTLPAWISEQCLGYAISLAKGQIMNFPEKQETVAVDVREIAPHTLVYPSRLWEIFASTVQVKIADTSRLKRFIYELCLPIGYKVGDLSFQGKKPNLFWRTLRAIAELMVFRALRDRMGLVRMRIPYTGGAVLGPDVIRFFRAIGVNLRQIYGITEGLVPTVHTADECKFESVGRPLPGVTLRLSEKGEILIAKENCFTGYYKDPEATERAFAGGWYHTADAGHIDEDGHLIYIDRMQDMRELRDGTKFSPQYIESRLKFSPYIKDAFVVGGEERDFVGAVISIDFDNVGNWAEKRRIAYTTFVDLSQRPEVCELIRKEILKLNKSLPERSRVRRFVNLHKEFDPDEAELTRTRKLRRTFVEDRYKELVEAVYGEREELVMSAPVVYRDGRKGVVSTKIRVTPVD